MVGFLMQSALLITLAAALLVSAAKAEEPEPVFPVRTLYAPGHFGNSYEVMGEREMRDCLAEAKFWGFNRYCDWLDTIDCADPFADPHYNLAGALWDRKKANFRSGQALGYACDLVITPNHVYLDQCRPDLVAEKGGRIFGQLICPSKPEARQIILKNYENLFADLAKAGVRLSALCPGPYDYGGCACEACRPWILTFAKLCREIQGIAEKYHPGIEMHFIGWWWKAEEHKLFAEWADREAPGWVKSIALHIPYGKLDVADVALPEGCERHAFVHIGYAEQAEPRDIYGHLGPLMAATRIQKTVAALEAHGCTGFMAYSEGHCDDVNKAVLAGIASGQYPDPDAVLRAYAERYFGAAGDQAQEWAEWLKAWGWPFQVDAAAALDTYDRLCQTASGETWRRRQWRLKGELLRDHAAIMQYKEWTPERLAAAESFWATKERLQRQVWGLGPVRHVFGRRFISLPWFKSWAQHMSEQVGALDSRSKCNTVRV